MVLSMSLETRLLQAKPTPGRLPAGHVVFKRFLAFDSAQKDCQQPRALRVEEGDRDPLVVVEHRFQGSNFRGLTPRHMLEQRCLGQCHHNERLKVGVAENTQAASVRGEILGQVTLHLSARPFQCAWLITRQMIVDRANSIAKRSKVRVAKCAHR
jgi:hypothetical protein